MMSVVRKLKELWPLAEKSIKEEGVLRFLKKAMSWLSHRILWDLHLFALQFSWYDSLNLIREVNKNTGADIVVKFKTVVNGFDYCEQNLLFHEVLVKGEETEVFLPEKFEGSKCETKQYECPDIYIAEFHEVNVYACSDLFSIGNIAISDTFVRDKEKRYRLRGGCILKNKAGRYLLTISKKSDVSIDRAICMVGWAANNYYHFTFEILSRLAFIDLYEKYRNWPILIDSCVIQCTQMKKLLDTVNVYRHPIIEVKEYTQIRVKELVYSSKAMWMPPNFEKGVVPQKKDYLFSKYVVENIRSIVFSQLVIQDDETEIRENRNIFLSRRNCKNQRLLNAYEVEQVFRKNGYRVVYTEELDFVEQVKLFYSAKIIVGATGAAFTNLVYCQKEAIAAIIAPESHTPYYFSNIAHMVGVKIFLLGADLVKKGEAASLDTFVMNEGKCIRFIQKVGTIQDA